jgi:predicted Zn-ribbon and HTH transcriptional regulator
MGGVKPPGREPKRALHHFDRCATCGLLFKIYADHRRHLGRCPDCTATAFAQGRLLDELGLAADLVVAR